MSQTLDCISSLVTSRAEEEIQGCIFVSVFYFFKNFLIYQKLHTDFYFSRILGKPTNRINFYLNISVW